MNRTANHLATPHLAPAPRALTALTWLAGLLAGSLPLAGCTTVDLPESEDVAEEPLAVTAAAAERDAEGDVCGRSEGPLTCTAGKEIPYHHPLQGLRRLPDGRLPFLDARRSPSGNVYAVGEGARALVDGSEEALFAGVVELPVRRMTAAERAEKPARMRSTRRIDKLDIPLREALSSPVAAGPLPVQIFLERTRTGTITQRIGRAIAEGRVATRADREAVRQDEMATLGREIAAALHPFAAQVRALGGEVTYTCEYAPCLSANLLPEQIRVLQQRPDVQRIGLLEDSTPDGLSGVQKAEVYQTRTFWAETFVDGGVTYAYDGDNGQSTDVRVAVLDDEGFRNTHLAFKEGTSGSRIDGMWDCRTPPCSAVAGFSGFSDHGTSVLGTLLGDYRDGQDPAVTTVTAREQRSASGGEAKAYLYWAQRSQGDQQAVYDSVVVRNPAPHLLVSSNSVGGATDCSGEDAKAVGADNVYESGIAYFKSANQGSPGSSTDCTVGPPGEAIGVFTVNGFDDPATTICDMKSAPIHASTNWGGATSQFSEGKYRSIIDLTASYQGAQVPVWTSDTGVGNFSGTSHANPSAASAAINFIDHMKNFRNSDFIDDPGVLYAWMLNMGDRRTAAGGKLVSRYDHRTGAGNIKMRFLGGPGLDTPWYLYNYELCVSDGEVVTLEINSSNTLSADVDSIRATAWWYDRRIETSDTIDDIDLQLRGTGGTLLQASGDSYDNKERIYASDVGGKAVKLEVRGQDVTSDGEGCGTNAMRVFVTVILEDNDRDDADGPDYDPATCEGVETL